jgi:hypothetical protein
VLIFPTKRRHIGGRAGKARGGCIYLDPNANFFEASTCCFQPAPGAVLPETTLSLPMSHSSLGSLWKAWLHLALVVARGTSLAVLGAMHKGWRCSRNATREDCQGTSPPRQRRLAVLAAAALPHAGRPAPHCSLPARSRQIARLIGSLGWLLVY